jgi:hypothetical protein
MLEDKAGIVLGGELRGKSGDDVACFLKADGTENVAGGEVAVGALNGFWADDVHGHRRSAKNGFGNGADQELSDGSGRVGCHHDAVD